MLYCPAISMPAWFREEGRRERQRIADEIAEIDGLIGNEETLRRCEFQFPLATSKPIAALAKPRTDGIQCTIAVEGKACENICCSIRQMRGYSWDVHRWKSKAVHESVAAKTRKYHGRLMDVSLGHFSFRLATPPLFSTDPCNARASIDWALPLGIGPTQPGKSNWLGPRAMRLLVIELCVDSH
jgi:hypothetical protein